jgi:hypothetical protein
MTTVAAMAADHERAATIAGNWAIEAVGAPSRLAIKG